MEKFNAAIEKRKLRGIIRYAASLLKIPTSDLAQLLFCLKYTLLDPELNYTVFADNKRTKLFWNELMGFLPTIRNGESDKSDE